MLKSLKKTAYFQPLTLKELTYNFKDRNIISVMAGNFFEFFDLYLFVHLSSYITAKFISPDAPKIIESLTVFAPIFLITPLSGFIFGAVGDSLGRKKVLTTTTVIMTLCTGILYFIPPYASIGLMSTLCLVLLRMIQGFSLGAEAVGCSLYILESVEVRTYGFYRCIVGLGETMSTVAVLAFSSIAIYFFGPQHWDLCLLINIVFLVFFSIQRRTLEESKDYQKFIRNKTPRPLHFLRNFRELQWTKRNFVCQIGLYLCYPIIFSVMYYYTKFLLIGSYGMSLNDVILHNMWAAIGECVLCGIFSMLILKLGWHPLRSHVLKLISGIIALVFLAFFSDYWSAGLPLWAITFFQIFLLFTVSRAEIIGFLFQAFHISWRFSNAISGWAIARIIGFIVTTFVLSYVWEACDKNVIFVILLVCMLLHLLSALFFYPSYLPYVASGKDDE